MENPVLLHSQFTESIYERLTLLGQCIFAATCCRRLLPLFSPKAEGRNQEVGEFLLNSTWAWVSGLADQPSNIDIAPLIQGDEDAEDAEEVFQATLQFERLICVLSGCPEEGKTIGYWNTALLDNYLYRIRGWTINAENSIRIGNESLMLQEVERQKRDLDLIVGAVNVELVARNLWKDHEDEHILQHANIKDK